MLLRNRRLEGQDGGGSPNPNPGLERGGTGGHPRNLSPRNSGWRDNFPFTWGYRNMSVFNPPQKKSNLWNSDRQVISRCANSSTLFEYNGEFIFTSTSPPSPPSYPQAKGNLFHHPGLRGGLPYRPILTRGQDLEAPRHRPCLWISYYVEHKCIQEVDLGVIGLGRSL